MPKKQAKAVPAVQAAEYCGNCQFYKRDAGICQYEPAKVIVIDGEVFSARPIMDSTEWCSKHQGPRQ